jgi:2-polyprenyl-6-methoxyphenol hydroxylase-like FAD-dependent oxidoreductase
MRVVVIGSGPAGLITAATLARRGHRVVSVDRDPGPGPDGWHRRGVMQFAHAHAFRPQVASMLIDQWPEAYDAWTDRGATPLDPPPEDPTMRIVLSRRETLERALREAALGQAGLELRTGHVDRLLLDEGGRAVGVVVDGASLNADLVVDASGRAGRVARASGVAEPAQLGGDCGLAYVDRGYRLREGAEPGPMNTPLGFIGELDGYQFLVFLHERGHLSVVLVRPTADPALRLLHDEVAFVAACAAIPALAQWTDPERTAPTSGVLVGGALRNVYRSQVLLDGLVTVGDAVATTTPTRGRGVAMACLQIGALLHLLDEGADPVTVAGPFNDWCAQNVAPWVADHIAIDGGMERRWRGEDIDLGGPLTSDLVADATLADPRIAAYAGGYFNMTALPETLRPAEPLAREVYGTGWRPPLTEGPSRDELMELIAAAAAVPA